MILDRIVAKVRQRLTEQRQRLPLEELKQQLIVTGTPDVFKNALRQQGIQAIAEIKKASPSAGIISRDFDPISLGIQYEQAGAAAISVLTERDFFMGSLDYLKAVGQYVSLPLLRKDFIIDPYQIYQAKYYGADCILLITRILSDEQLVEFQQLAKELHLDCLVEVHDAFELDRALKADAEIIGINNRDLTTFRVNIENSLHLRQVIPDGIVTVSESGIKNREHVRQLERAKFDAILIGESLMRSEDKKTALHELYGRLERE